MSDVRLSSATKAILAAAKADGPGATARAKVWSGVSSAVVGAAAAGAAASSGAGTALTASSGAAKMLAVGLLLGGAITVGLAQMVFHVQAVPTEPSPASGHVVAQAPPASGAPLPDRLMASPSVAGGASVEPTQPSTEPTAPVVVVAPTEPARAPRTKAGAGVASSLSQADTLTRESALVAEARRALARGDARGALRSIHATHELRPRQLIPEETALESQAYRALGRDTEANEDDALLRSKYPESALAR